MEVFYKDLVMEKENVIAIDYGTQSVRVSIVDKTGKFLAWSVASL